MKKTSSKRVAWVGLIAMVVATLPASIQGAADESTRPNVLLIMADDLGYGDLSGYGGKDVKTPHLDGLMAEGMRFSEFYANCCVCSPTRAALLSGRYPELVGIPGVVRSYRSGNFGFLTPESIMLPGLFQKAGYHTTLVGMWHLGLSEANRPNQRGFDEFHGFLGDMMEDYWTHRRHGKNYMRKNEAEIDPAGHATDLFTRWAIESIRQRAGSGKPWFQFLSYNAPHSPVQPPKDWLAKVVAREPGITDKRAKLVALVEHMDDGIGKVLEALKQSGQFDNTLVIFTSDNGGSLPHGASNGPLRSGKTHIYEGGIKVPTFIRWPGHVGSGKKTDFQALTMDILPTVADICAVPINHEVDGRSFRKLLLKNDQQPFARPVYHMWLQDGTKEAMRQGDWKLVRDQKGAAFELYNIAQDPYEKVDLANKHPEKLQAMAQLLTAHMQRANQVPWKKPAR
mgnify:CR=1 FL=1